ncbi:MAG: cytochrome P450 [Pseudomonadales bacterium]
MPTPVDLSSDASFAAGFPHEYFGWLRAEHPLYWHEPTAETPDGEGFWVLSRYADVAAVVRDPQRFSSQTGAGLRSAGGTGIKDERAAGVSLNMTDDPQHRRLRALVNKGFTPKAVGNLQVELQQRFADTLSGVADGGFDVMTSIARELPLQTICIVLGVPQSDRASLIGWIDEGLQSDSPSILAREPLKKIRDYAIELIRDKRKQPGADILSTIVRAQLQDGSALSDREAIAFFTLLFPAGAETTRSALGGAIKAFIDYPQQYQRLRAQPELRRSAIEEIVRWTTPSVYKRRTASCDVQMLDQHIRAGDKVTFWEMSANRDERAFSEPFQFDVSRWPNRHLGFGAGVHFCLGASLARLELGIALQALCQRYSGFEAAGAHRWTPNNRLLGLQSLPVRAHLARD